MRRIPVRESSRARDRIDSGIEVFLLACPTPGETEFIDPVNAIAADAEKPNPVRDLVLQRGLVSGLVGLSDDLGDIVLKRRVCFCLSLKCGKPLVRHDQAWVFLPQVIQKRFGIQMLVSHGVTYLYCDVVEVRNSSLSCEDEVLNDALSEIGVRFIRQYEPAFHEASPNSIRDVTVHVDFDQERPEFTFLE